jgi:hypothetical protein
MLMYSKPGIKWKHRNAASEEKATGNLPLSMTEKVRVLTYAWESVKASMEGESVTVEVIMGSSWLGRSTTWVVTRCSDTEFARS